MDVINSTPFAKLLREDTNKMLAQLEGKRPAEDLVDDKGVYIGPRIIDDEEGYAAEEAMMAHESLDGDSEGEVTDEGTDEEEDATKAEVSEELLSYIKTKSPTQRPPGISDNMFSAVIKLGNERYS